MTRWIGLVVIVGWMVVGAAVPASGQEVPFIAQVTENIAPVRAGAGRSFYVVTQLANGTHVTVEQVVFGWYKIRPPQGAYSYISKAFVEVHGNGQSGTISAARAAVRAASVNGSGESYRRQIDLLQGDTVQIVGEDGSFYKILSPQGAYVFLPPGTIRPLALDAKPADPVPGLAFPRTDPPPGHPPQPTPGAQHQQPDPWPDQAQEDDTPHPPLTANPQPTGQQQAEATPPPTVVEDLAQAQPASPNLVALEKKLIESLKIPLEQQPIQELLAAYTAIAGQPDLSLIDRRIIALRISQLNRNAAVVETLQEITQAKQSAQADPIYQYADELPPTESQPRYSVEGQLLTSGVYDGKNMPRLFRVTEVSGKRVITYARLSPTLNPAPYIGRLVGIVGQTKYDPTLRLEVLEAERLELIR